MLGRALRSPTSTTSSLLVTATATTTAARRAHDAAVKRKKRVVGEMGEELPILKGILNGVVNYHNARRCH